MSDEGFSLYHERQRRLLCGQHTLNNLLQGAHFDARGLASIANDLDDKEKQLLDPGEVTHESNHDRAGNFSIQVLRVALQSHNLSIEQLSFSYANFAEQRAEAMDAGHALLVNEDEHWFAFRQMNGEWWDLDSTNRTPRPMARVDLDTFLQELQTARQDSNSLHVVHGQLPAHARGTDQAGDQKCWHIASELVAGPTTRSHGLLTTSEEEESDDEEESPEWAEHEEEADDEACRICDKTTSTPRNPIMFCDGCDGAEHRKCAGVAAVPEGDWFCAGCTKPPGDAAAAPSEIDAGGPTRKRKYGDDGGPDCTLSKGGNGIEWGGSVGTDQVEGDGALAVTVLCIGSTFTITVKREAVVDDLVDAIAESRGIANARRAIAVFVAGDEAPLAGTQSVAGRMADAGTAEVSMLQRECNDRQILEDIYNGNDGANWDDSAGWMTDVPLGEWHGVTADADGNVAELDFKANRKVLGLPVSFGGLTCLEKLNLNGCSKLKGGSLAQNYIGDC